MRKSDMQSEEVQRVAKQNLEKGEHWHKKLSIARALNQFKSRTRVPEELFPSFFIDTRTVETKQTSPDDNLHAYPIRPILL
jgi:hypothetical protein